jgi:hypothetical protein
MRCQLLDARCEIAGRKHIIYIGRCEAYLYMDSLLLTYDCDFPEHEGWGDGWDCFIFRDFNKHIFLPYTINMHQSDFIFIKIKNVKII